jgi:hypothetical protein
VYLRALFTYLPPPPPLSHRPPHPETDSVGAAPLISVISVQYHARCRRKTLIWTTGARNTTHKTPKTPGLASPTQAETVSGVCPTNLRITAGSSRMKTTKLSYFIVTSCNFIFRSQKYFFAFIFTSNCYDGVMITSPQKASR